MAEPNRSQGFTHGDAYDRQMDQWSRAIGRDILDSLNLSNGLWRLDAGCGLVRRAIILNKWDLSEVIGIDLSKGLIAFAKPQIENGRVQLMVGDAQSIDFAHNSFDVAVAALVLNLVPDFDKVVSDMKRVVRPSKTVATYVWDLANDGHPMTPISAALRRVDANAPGFGDSGSDVGPANDLMDIFGQAGLTNILVKSFETLVHYDSMDEYWSIATNLQGPRGAFVRALGNEDLELFRKC